MSLARRPDGPKRSDVLERALAALPHAPPPPTVERVFAPGADARLVDLERNSRVQASLALAASLLLICGGGVWVASNRLDSYESNRTDHASEREIARAPQGAVRITADPAAGVRFLRSAPAGDQTIAAADARTGDRLEALAGGVIRLDDRVAVTLEPDAGLTLLDRGAVQLDAGRATFQVAHEGPAAFQVRAGRVTVLDVGTRFTVDRTERSVRDRLLVTVEEGRVEANGIPLDAGQGLAFQEGVAVGASWRLDAKPSITLEVEDPTPKASAPVVLRMVLSNPTEEWVGWPSISAGRSPLMVSVVDPAGVPTSVRVTDAMMLTERPFGRAIPPRGSLVLRVRFERTFASPGTYRLQAVYRPAGDVESPTSPEVVMEVR